MIVERCAALDVREDTVTACVRRPAPKGREEEVREFRTDTSSLRQLRSWLVCQGVTHVAMDATGVHWRPIWHVLEVPEDVELLLVNAHHVRTLPGRGPAVGDACWLARLVEYGLLFGCVVPPAQLARLRDVSRCRRHLVEQRAGEARRVQQALEDAGIDQPTLPTDLTDPTGLTAAIDRLDEEMVRLTGPYAGPVQRARGPAPAAGAGPQGVALSER